METAWRTTSTPIPDRFDALAEWLGERFAHLEELMADTATQTLSSLADAHAALDALKVTLTQLPDAIQAKNQAATDALAQQGDRITALQGVIAADDAEAQAMLAEIADLQAQAQVALAAETPVPPAAG